MATELKAIETVYKGHRFRSRLEARWAVFFDALGVKYEYEKEGYDLGRVGWYLPDFYLPEEEVWIEIKGQTPSESDIDKAIALSGITERYVFMFIGQIVPFAESTEFHPVHGIRQIYTNSAVVYFCGEEKPAYRNHWARCSHCGRTSINRWGMAGGCNDECYEKSAEWHIGANHPDICNAYIKAIQARFEHGERG